MHGSDRKNRLGCGAAALRETAQDAAAMPHPVYTA